MASRPLPPELQAVESLLHELTRSTYIWRMASAIHEDHAGDVGRHSRSLVRSARTRRRHALEEALRVLERRGWSNPLTELGLNTGDPGRSSDYTPDG